MRRRRSGSRWTITTLTFGALLIAISSGSAVAQEPDSGQEIYQSNCASCHGADGLGAPGVFPPLVGNPRIQDADYVGAVIREGLSGPLEVNGEAYDGTMPAFGVLSDEQIAFLITFLQEDFAAEGAPPVTVEGEPEGAPAATDGGDAVRGEDLFLGATSFAGGGPACMACHTAGSHGNLGGSGLGPDLTDVHERLGGTAGLTAVLENPAFLVMRTAYEDKAISEQERLDLAAFLATTVDEEPSVTFNQLVAFGIVGAALLFVIMAIFMPWRRSYARRLGRST